MVLLHVYQSSDVKFTAVPYIVMHNALYQGRVSNFDKVLVTHDWLINLIKYFILELVNWKSRSQALLVESRAKVRAK